MILLIWYCFQSVISAETLNRVGFIRSRGSHGIECVHWYLRVCVPVCLDSKWTKSFSALDHFYFESCMLEQRPSAAFKLVNGRD